MNIFQWALKKTLSEFEIRGAHLAKESKFGEGNLSNYLTGSKDVYTATLHRLYNCLPNNAKAYYLSVIAGMSVKAERPTLNDLIDLLDPAVERDRKEAADAMRKIVDKFLPEPEKTSVNTDTPKQATSLKSL